MKYPFDYFVIDGFLTKDKIDKISREFPDYNSDVWYCYNNALENKKTCNSWYYFGPETYQLLHCLNSDSFISRLKEITGIQNLYPDIGLHGGGLHIHGRGGKLNVHLDYSIHPKLKLQRKINLILYLSNEWDSKWGGSLEFWSHDEKLNKPKERVVSIENSFNRAVIFDTTQNSWHGFPEPITCPEGRYRKSLAVYYLTDPPEKVDKRQRALYAPSKDQENDPQILNFIKERATL